MLGNDAIELGLEPGCIGKRKVDAYTPIAAARSEHEVKGVDDGWSDHAGGCAHFQQSAVPFVDARYNRIWNPHVVLHFYKLAC